MSLPSVERASVGQAICPFCGAAVDLSLLGWFCLCGARYVFSPTIVQTYEIVEQLLFSKDRQNTGVKVKGCKDTLFFITFSFESLPNKFRNVVQTLATANNFHPITPEYIQERLAKI